MTELLTAAQMREIEQAAIASGAVTGLELMERAGRGVVEAVFEEWPDLANGTHRAVVLCGPGNNGGDGFVVARLLKEAGWEVDVFLYGDAEKLPPDAKVNHERWEVMGSSQPMSCHRTFAGDAPDIVIDAVFGIGLNRPLVAELADLLDCRARRRWNNWSKTQYVAVDCPSGLDCETGDADRFMKNGNRTEPEARIVNLASLTVTFHSPKIGHYLGDGPSVSGALRVMDIGLWKSDRNTAMPGLRGSANRVLLMEPVFLGKPLSTGPFLKGMIEKHVGDHKYTHGHALILSGGVGKGGAARMAARGALRIGAGLVTVGCPPAALIENAAQLNAIMLRSVKDADALVQLLGDDRLNAVCVGPGLGLSAREAALVAAAVRAEHTPYVVLDGDALTLIARDPAVFALLHDKCVLTPHGGEFERLFPDIAEQLEAPATKGPAFSKVAATREAAKRAGCVVLFKGPDTVIAHPDGRCSINSAQYDRAAPWLATAGSGDVLAGFITGLLARNFDPMQATETAAWLHVECALSFGPGLIAEDLPEELPKVFRQLGL